MIVPAALSSRRVTLPLKAPTRKKLDIEMECGDHALSSSMSMGSGRGGFVSGSGSIAHRVELLRLWDRAREAIEDKAVDIS
jgi:hypothetical protein